MTKPDANWSAIESHFSALVDLDLKDRATYFQKHQFDETFKQDLLDLLAAYDRDPAFLEQEPSLKTNLGSQMVGPYKLIRPIGEGGMGKVFLVQKKDHKSSFLALKRLKSGLNKQQILERFQKEQFILSQLHHPNICTFLDSGETQEGRPYYVMEFIEGKTLAEYLIDEVPSLESRLALFYELCLAVQYAHQHLIVHRDLKPSNIMVTENGRPKLLDFGIAKILGTGELETEVDQRALTKKYGSPEQWKGNTVTTGSDIFSLGLLLFEMICGVHPFDIDENLVGFSSPHFQLPPIGPTSQRQNRGKMRSKGYWAEMDVILAKATHIDPKNRYVSVQQFCEDLKRLERGLPILAKPDTVWYQTRKFIGRNKWSMTLIAIFFLFLSTFSVTLIQKNKTIMETTERLQKEHQQAESIKNILAGLFDSADPMISPQTSQEMGRLLQSKAAEIQSEFSGNLDLQFELNLILARVHHHLGNIETSHDISSDLCQNTPRHFVDNIGIEALALLAENQRELGKYEASIQSHQKVIDKLATSPNLARRSKAHRQLANSLNFSGQFEVAKMEAEHALSLAEAGGSILEEANSKHQLGMIANNLSDYQASEQYLSEALESKKQIFTENHPRVLEAMNHHSTALSNMGKYELAEEGFEKVIKTESVLGNHPLIAIAYYHLGGLYNSKGEWENAEKQYKKALQIRREIYRPDHPTILACLRNLGAVNNKLGQLEVAETYLTQVFQILSTDKSQASGAFFQVLQQLSSLYLAMGKSELALNNAQMAFELAKARLEPDSPHLATLKSHLAAALAANYQFEEAEKHWSEALAIYQAKMGENHLFAGIVLVSLVENDLWQNRLFQTKERLNKAATIHHMHLTEDNPRMARLFLAEIGYALCEKDKSKARLALQKLSSRKDLSEEQKIQITLLDIEYEFRFENVNIAKTQFESLEMDLQNRSWVSHKLNLGKRRCQSVLSQQF